MAELTSQQRNRLPDSAFAGPNRTYPIPDASHAADAKARAAQMRGRGLMSAAEQSQINGAANRVLHGKR
jgi:hypothetical protein